MQRAESAPIGSECFTAAHASNTERIVLFDDVLTSLAKQPSANDDNIFFHETQCQHGEARLNFRQACSIESAARMNPQHQVYVLFASPTGFARDPLLPLPANFRPLANYANIHLRNLDVWRYVVQTPAERWLWQRDLFNSSFPIAHMADLLRLVSLFRYGGTYMDMDFIVRKPFGPLAANYAGEESVGFANTAVLNFAASGAGHQIVAKILSEFVRTFNGTEWSFNGPLLLRRVLKRICENRDAEERQQCAIFKVLPRNAFNELYYAQWQNFFEPQRTAKTLKRIGDSVAVHFWNSLSSMTPVRVGQGSTYEVLAKEYCPTVFAALERDTF